MSKAKVNLATLRTKYGMDLAPGTKKDGTQYARKLSVEPGYSELVDIVAALQKDVQKINQCITLPGAQNYASKKKNWTAHEEDITGPNGKPDGIKEVFVTDALGNIKVINGYTLKKTKYPFRKAYRTANPTPEDRKQNKFSTFMTDLSQIHEGFDDDGAPYYENKAGDISQEFAHIQPEISVKDLYKQLIFKPQYDQLKDEFKAAGMPPMIMARVFNKALNIGFNHHVRDQVLASILGDDPSKFDKKLVNKVIKSDEFRKESQELIKNIFNTPSDISTCQSEASDIISTIADEFNPRRNQQAQGAQPEEE